MICIANWIGFGIANRKNDYNFVACGWTHFNVAFAAAASLWLILIGLDCKLTPLKLAIAFCKSTADDRRTNTHIYSLQCTCLFACLPANCFGQCVQVNPNEQHLDAIPFKRANK